MRIAIVIAAALGCGLAACGNKKKSEPVETGKPVAIADAGLDAAALEAANELDVARYEDEVAVDHVPLKVKTSAALAFKSYPMGDLIVTLDRDDDVVQLSERYGFYRVTFSDPKHRSRKLMGWIGHFAFEPPPAKKKFPLLRCRVGTGQPGTALVVLEDPPRCAYVCKDAAECVATGSKCEARIVVPQSSGEITSSPSYTTVCTAAAKSPEAGVGGKKPPPSLFGTSPPVNGKCPRLFTPAPKVGPLCYRSCKTDIECPEGSMCKAFGKTKLCSVN